MEIVWLLLMKIGDVLTKEETHITMHLALAEECLEMVFSIHFIGVHESQGKLAKLDY